MKLAFYGGIHCFYPSNAGINNRIYLIMEKKEE